MIFRDTSLRGVYVVEPEQRIDERGTFARWFDREVFARRGLIVEFDQDSFARNTHAGTIRGMHFARWPHTETKLVTCVAGAAFDVVLDLRPGPSFGRHICVELDASSWRTVYIPEGCAHGYQVRVDETVMLYRICGPYRPEAAAGVNAADPHLAIAWPLPPTVVSERDAALPAFDSLITGFGPVKLQTEVRNAAAIRPGAPNPQERSTAGSQRHNGLDRCVSNVKPIS